MSSLKTVLMVGGYLAISIFMLHLLSIEALAADSSGDWRPIFDLVMRWVNFFILAFLLVKFSRLPIKNFLKGKKDDITRDIEELEADKKQMLREIDESRKQIENSKERLSQLKKTIIAQGEKNKIKIIEDAEQESKIFLESAKQKIESRIADAREVLKAELVDDAITLAMKKLPEIITDQDNQKFIDAFIKSAAST
ncbi:MAG: ATP synthase F0 subunit B [Deltaproteobacteria bacterium]|nr:ATP synthase F0 subunit B [Deltaproteobacteria bacterium]